MPVLPSLDTIVIGAGQAGLAISRCLSDRSVDHVVLERGRVAERWRTERWDSLRLLTPNWMSRLPSWSYDGPDPDGFMTAGEVADFFARYARSSDAPVEEQSAVESLRFDGEKYELRTTNASWTAARVVIATGWSDRPAIPALAGELSADVRQIAPNRYQNPSSVPDGGVLVVGASATGVQLADELRAAGRDVVLAVGRHSRLPRRYRGMDIFWWLDRIGVRDKTIDEMPDPARARHEPSLQLVGGPDRRSVDLTTLQDAGVQIAGRVVGMDGHHVRFAEDVNRTVTDADRRMRRVLADIDRHIDETGLSDEVLAPEPMAPVRPAPAPDRLDLREPRHYQRGVGDGAPAHLPVAPRARARRARRDPQCARRDPSARALRARPALPARPQQRQHRRRRPGCRVRRRSPDLPDGRDPPPLTPETAMHSERPSYDAIIVGARAAGAATAMLLARQGRRVLVVDRGRYGADTLSTHGLMRGGVLQLQRWGLIDRVIEAGTPPIRRTTFTYDSRQVVITIKPSFGVDALYAPRRTVLDPILVDAAAEAGAEICYGVTVTDVSRDDHGRVTGIVGRDEDGRASRLRRRHRHRCRRRPLHDRPTRRARRSSAPAAAPPPSCTATGPDLDTDGYEWIYRPGSMAGDHPHQRRPGVRLRRLDRRPSRRRRDPDAPRDPR